MLCLILETQLRMKTASILCPRTHIRETFLNRKKAHEVGCSVFHRLRMRVKTKPGSEYRSLGWRMVKYLSKVAWVVIT